VQAVKMIDGKFVDLVSACELFMALSRNFAAISSNLAIKQPSIDPCIEREDLFIGNHS
jgi:hypothetical protein